MRSSEEIISFTKHTMSKYLIGFNSQVCLIPKNKLTNNLTLYQIYLVPVKLFLQTISKSIIFTETSFSIEGPCKTNEI